MPSLKFQRKIPLSEESYSPLAVAIGLMIQTPPRQLQKIKMRYFILALVFLLSACGGREEESAATDQHQRVNPGELPEGFADFYQRFHSDSIYQMQHIVFPLEGLPDNADSLTLASQNFHWQAEDWRMQRQFDFEMSEFKRDIIPLNENMVLERIIHKSGELGMVRRFALVGNEWHLIYYAGLNRLAKQPD